MRTKVAPYSSQAGQIAVVILLLMAVLLVMGLSLATRTTQEVFLSQQSSESARVWNTAETGAEEALSLLQENKTPEQISDQITNYEDSGNNAKIQDLSVTQTNNLTTRVNEMEVAEVFLGGSIAGNVHIYWGKELPGACSTRADLLISVYYTQDGDMRVEHHPVAARCDGNIVRNNSFDGTKTTDVYLQDHRNLFTINVKNGTGGRNDQMIRIRPLYNSTDLLVFHQNGTLPAQQHTITSRARNLSGDEERAVQVTRSRPIAPGILDFALYSGGGITKP